MKGLLILSLLALSFASPSTASFDNVIPFLQGLESGLSKNTATSDKCTGDVNALALDVRDMYWDIQRVVKGDEMALMALLNDVKGTMADFNTTKTDCDYSDLVFKIKELTSAGGQNLILGRILENSKEMMSNLKTLTEHCDAKSCGEAVGDSLQIILDWGL